MAAPPRAGCGCFGVSLRPQTWLFWDVPPLSPAPGSARGGNAGMCWDVLGHFGWWGDQPVSGTLSVTHTPLPTCPLTPSILPEIQQSSQHPEGCQPSKNQSSRHNHGAINTAIKSLCPCPSAWPRAGARASPCPSAKGIRARVAPLWAALPPASASICRVSMSLLLRVVLYGWWG